MYGPGDPEPRTVRLRALRRLWDDRDRKVNVTLQWDLVVTDNPIYGKSKRWGLVKVVNTGRRPVYVSHVALRLPKGADPTASHLILAEGIAGEELGEGDSPRLYFVDQDSLTKYTRHWERIRAQVSDSTGKEWTSKLNEWQKSHPPIVDEGGDQR